jgi:hypothetical protein
MNDVGPKIASSWCTSHRAIRSVSLGQAPDRHGGQRARQLGMLDLLLIPSLEVRHIDHVAELGDQGPSDMLDLGQ